MSQATAVVFAGYFEIEPEVNHSSGLLADRIRDLELKLVELSGSPSSFGSELLKEAVSELRSELSDILLKEVNSSINEIQKALFDRLESRLESSIQKQPQSSLPSKPQSKNVDARGNKQLGLAVEDKSSEEPIAKKIPKSKPKKLASSKKPRDVASPNGKDILTTAQLSERFKCASSLPSKQKGRYKDEPEKFTNWSKGKDPDGFSWEFKEGSTLYYRIKPLA
jgi:hypothetical protein